MSWASIYRRRGWRRPRKTAAHRALTRADAARLPIADESFASIVAVSACEHFARPADAIAEAYRVLEPGGRFVATIVLADLRGHLFYPRLLRRAGLRRLAPLYLRLHDRAFDHRALESRRWWETRLIEAGFSLVDGPEPLDRSDHYHERVVYLGFLPLLLVPKIAGCSHGCAAKTGEWVTLPPALPRVRFLTTEAEDLTRTPIDRFDAARVTKLRRSLAGDIQIVTETPHQISIDLVAPSSGWLVLADTWYPGWRCRVDGCEQSLIRANEVFRGVAVATAGKHRIVFSFSPRSFFMARHAH